MDLGMIGSAVAAGLLSFFSPCVLPLIPVYVGMLAGTADGCPKARSRQLANTVAFVLGISFVFVALGAAAGTLGSLINNPYVAIALGLVVCVFGLHMAGAVKIPLLQRECRANMGEVRRRGKGGPVASFLLGLAFSFGWTPCVGPVLGTILALAAEQGSALVGAGLLLVYALGLCVPFLVISLASDLLLTHVRKLNRFLPTVQRVGGALIAVMGLWMVFSQVNALVTASRVAQEELAQQSVAEQAAAGQGGSAAGDGSADAAAGAAGASAFGASDSAVASDSSAPTEVNLLEVSAGDADTDGVSSAWKNVVLTDLDGNKHRLSELKGEPVYFEFWGSWCASCVQDLDQLTEVWREHEEAGDVRVVSVVVPGFYGERSAEDFVAWARENNVEVPVYMDTRSSLSTYLNVGAFPTSVFINSDGSLAKIRIGAIERDELERLLAELS